MRLPREFLYYVKNGIIKKQAPDKSRAESLIKESNTSLKGLRERVSIIPINEFNATSIIKDSYDIIMGLIRARMHLQGYISSGNYAHEGEVAYLQEMHFPDPDISFLNELRYLRNSTLYYGKSLNAEYAQKVYTFLKRIVPKINVEEKQMPGKDKKSTSKREEK